MGQLRTELEQRKHPVDRQLSKDQFGETIDLDEVFELKRKLADQEVELGRLKATRLQETNGIHKVLIFYEKNAFFPEPFTASKA